MHVLSLYITVCPSKLCDEYVYSGGISGWLHVYFSYTDSPSGIPNQQCNQQPHELVPFLIFAMGLKSQMFKLKLQ